MQVSLPLHLQFEITVKTHQIKEKAIIVHRVSLSYLVIYFMYSQGCN